MKKILKLIDDKIEASDSYTFKETDKFLFFQQLLMKIKSFTPLNLYKLSLDEFLLSAILTSNPEIDFNEVNECVNSIKPILNNLDDNSYSSLYEFVRYLEILKKDGNITKLLIDINEVENYTKYRNKLLINNLDSVINLTVIETLSKRVFPSNKKGKDKFNYDYNLRNHFIKTFLSCKDTEPFFEVFEFDSEASMKRDIDFQKLEIINETSREIRRFVKRKLSEYKASDLEILHMICEYYKDIYNQKIKEQKSCDKIKSRYQRLKYIIENLKPTEIMTIDNSISKLVSDEDIALELEIFAMNHNFPIYKKAMDESTEFENNNFTKTELEFSKNGFSFDRLSINQKDILLKHGSIDNISKLLIQIKKNNFGIINENFPYIIDILLFSSSDILEKLVMLCESDCINYDYIAANLGILFSEEKCMTLNLKSSVEAKYEKFCNVIALLNSEKINIRTVTKNNPNILNMETKELQKRLKTFKKYKIVLTSDEITNYDFIEEPDMLNILDDFFELGYGDFIKNNPHFLTEESILIIKRLLVTRMINMEKSDVIGTSGRLLKYIRTSGNFIQKDENLDDFRIISSDDFLDKHCKNILDTDNCIEISKAAITNSIIVYFDQNYLDEDMLYHFGDVNISKNRVLRNLTALLNSIKTENIESKDLILQAILYKNATITDPEQIEMIEECIKKSGIAGRMKIFL